MEFSPEEKKGLLQKLTQYALAEADQEVRAAQPDDDNDSVK